MKEFLMCFNLNIITRYFLGYFIGGTVAHLCTKGCNFWILFMVIIGIILMILDVINFLLSKLDIDNDKYASEKQQILKEKAEQKRREGEL